jgi:hypothetical protein
MNIKLEDKKKKKKRLVLKKSGEKFTLLSVPFK